MLDRLRSSTWPEVARAENVAIWKAARAGNEEKLHALIEASLDDVGRDERSWVHNRRLNWQHDRKGTTPLMAAAQHKRGAAAVSELLARGVDVNAVDATKQLNSALHYAALSNDDAVATEHLLLAGADAFRLNRKGLTPLDIARMRRKPKVAHALLLHMQVHADWLYVRGKVRWKKRWAVLLACNPQRTSTELCLYKSPRHVRPEAVLLADDAARAFPFGSSDSYFWLKHPFAFTLSKPVMWQQVKRQQFTRAPVCRKTMTHEDAHMVHVVLAAETKARQDAWMQLLATPARSGSTLRRSINGSMIRDSELENYYWPHEVLEEEELPIAEPQDDADLGVPAAPAVARQPSVVLGIPVEPASPVTRALPEAAMVEWRGQDRPFAVLPMTSRSRSSSSQSSDSMPRFAEDEIVSEVIERRTEVSRQRSLTFAPLPDEEEQVMADQERYERQRRSGSNSTFTSSGSETMEATVVVVSAPPGEQQEGLPTREEPPRRPSVGQREPCLICVSAPRDAACAPCGHLAACHSCLMTSVQTYRVCPICRARVHSVIRIYDA